MITTPLQSINHDEMTASAPLAKSQQQQNCEWGSATAQAEVTGNRMSAIQSLDLQDGEIWLVSRRREGLVPLRLFHGIRNSARHFSAIGIF